VGVAAAAVVVGIVVAPGQAVAAPAPTGLAPNSESTPVKNVELSWNPTGAASYRVQITDATFAKPAVDTPVSMSRFAVPSTLPRGVWAWRVSSDGGSTWSSTARFFHYWADTPGNPRLVRSTPASSEGPVLTWDAVPDASFYEVQLSLEPFRILGPGSPDDAGTPLDPSKPEQSVCYTQGTVFVPYTTIKGTDNGVHPDAAFRCTEIGATAGLADVYWRVRARDGHLDARIATGTPAAGYCTGVYFGKTPAESGQSTGCSGWAYPSGPFSNDIHIGPGAPAAPTGLDIGPQVGAQNPPVVSNTPVYTWAPVTDASFYRVFLAGGEAPNTTSSINDWDHVWETTGTALSIVSHDPEWFETNMAWTVVACRLTTLGDNLLALDYEAGDQTCGNPAPTEYYKKRTPDTVQRIGTSVTDANTGATTFTWSTMLDNSKPGLDTVGAETNLQVAVTDAAGYQLQVSGPDGNFNAPSQNPTSTASGPRRARPAGRCPARRSPTAGPGGCAPGTRPVTTSTHGRRPRPRPPACRAHRSPRSPASTSTTRSV
jgi:hypothetical protein